MKIFTCVFISLLAASVSTAETIYIPIGQQAPDKQHVERPQRGMSQEGVLARWGEPINTTEAVGEPPISHWVYGEFVVYFESSTVIHSVLKHTPKFPVVE